MNKIVGVKFRDYGQIYYFDDAGLELEPGNRILVSTEQGEGLGEVVTLRDSLPADAETDELKPVSRIAQEEDLQAAEENSALELEARTYCNECVKNLGLDMKLVDVEVFFDRSKIVFYFTAPTRIDFRELVKDLVKNYRTRIELRQIGVRHETQMIGAVGNCGMVCCCRRFLRKFAPVTIKMAKEQNLFLNPAKISGICGRLLCCLSYEQENYEDFHRRCPKLGKKYQTDDGAVKVLRANMFRSSVTLLRDGGEEIEITLDDWRDSNPHRPDAPQQPVQQPKPAPQEKKEAEPSEQPAEVSQDAATAGSSQNQADSTSQQGDAEEKSSSEKQPEVAKATPDAGAKTDKQAERRRSQVKSADGTSRRTTRGKRKRKRRPRGDEFDQND
ncbi:PSP1 domain-containing protein [Oleidesulfovibrio sp.]|uniref:PSP1 domain-containing protein n=1 Tax=Oleidesulfovibrio sp. TaxID=2909707 RepID=UPI003A89DD5E